jgi:hypothetical protein
VSHLHDGGVRLVLTADDQTVCDSPASYGGSDYVNSKDAMSYAGSATEHISNMKACDPSKAAVKSMKKGQKWNITAYYDYDKYKGMLGEDLEQEPVMGLALMYVRVKK